MLAVRVFFISVPVSLIDSSPERLRVRKGDARKKKTPEKGALDAFIMRSHIVCSLNV